MWLCVSCVCVCVCARVCACGPVCVCVIAGVCLRPASTCVRGRKKIKEERERRDISQVQRRVPPLHTGGWRWRRASGQVSGPAVPPLATAAAVSDGGARAPRPAPPEQLMDGGSAGARPVL